MAQISGGKFINSCAVIYSSRLGFESSEKQKTEIQNYTQKHGFKIESYFDSASFEALAPVEIAQRFAKVQQNAVLIWRLDCLPNTIKSLEDLFKIFSSLSKRNICFVSVVDNIDTDTSAQAFSMALDEAWRDFKRNRKITNARASSIKSKSKDIKPKVGRKKLRDDSLMVALRKAGLSIREIASKTGFSTTAVQRALNSQISKNKVVTKQDQSPEA
jgi:DNA invertase Pin-like site-specific DNA recombinase